MSTDMFDRTPLHHACRNNNLTAVNHILNWVQQGYAPNFDINAKASGGDTPLMKAAEAGNLEICKKLLLFG